MNPYLASFIATFVAAAAGAVASASSKDFYATLVKPEWAPPSSVFGPVWTVLYVLIAIAGGVAISAVGWANGRAAASVFIVQLVLNGLWSYFFFSFKNGGLAMADIVLMWIAIAANIYLFWRIKPLSGALMIPYLLWVTFALLLNWSLWQMNPGKL